MEKTTKTFDDTLTINGTLTSGTFYGDDECFNLEDEEDQFFQYFETTDGKTYRVHFDITGMDDLGGVTETKPASIFECTDEYTTETL